MTIMNSTEFEQGEDEEEGLCVEELLRRQNRLLKDIHRVAVSVSRGFAAFILVAKFLSWVIGVMATVAGAIGLIKFMKGL